jgi:hypothetical protein
MLSKLKTNRMQDIANKLLQKTGDVENTEKLVKLKSKPKLERIK